MTTTAGTDTVAVDTRPLWSRVPQYDELAIWVLSAMARFEEIQRQAHSLGAELFPAGPYRELARSIITKSSPRPGELTRAERRELARAQQLVLRCHIPHTLEWARHLLGLLAERSHRELAASSLEWAAQMVREHRPIRWVRGTVNRTLDIAEGLAPFDASAGWEQPHAA